VAQMEALKRRNEELQTKVKELEKQNQEVNLLLNDSNNTTSKTDHQIQLLRDLNKQERERALQELRDCNIKWEQKTSSMEQVIYELQESNNKSKKTITDLDQQINHLKLQKKILKQGIKDLRDKIPSTVPASPTTTGPSGPEPAEPTQ